MNVVQLFDMRPDILVAGSKRKQADDFALQLVSLLGLVFFDDLRLKGTGPITRRIEFKAPSDAFDGLGC